jgi:protein-S-isoprenylcysteine O-methyltransferase Ste14
MDNSSSQTIKSRTITPNTAALKMLLGFMASLILTLVLLFGGAGRLNWKLGWLFAGVWILPKLGFLILLRWRNPDLLIERATRHANTQPYERIILPVYFVLAFGTFLVGSLDGGRFQWSGELPGWLIVAAYIIYLLGNGLAGWAMNANPFFSSESRTQPERGHYVVSSGPYRYVRHPSYLATLLLWPVTGPMLGSWWAVIPAVMGAGVATRRILNGQMVTVDGSNGTVRLGQI